MPAILILDDDRQFCEMLGEHIRLAGHGVSFAHSVAEGSERASSYAYDVVFLDIRLPDGSGLDILPRLKTGVLPPEVIIITGFEDGESAELAMRYGAWDYVRKSSSIQSVLLSLQRALRFRETRKAHAGKVVAFYVPDLVGHSSGFRACLDRAAQAANSDVNVLVTGETGTGKELFAKAIHDNSSRKDVRFVVVDCTALPENLVASVLFGHEKGAFTGADRKSEGLISQAHGGTLFLDEIGDMPLDLQKSFLRVLQEHRYRPVGAHEEMASDFRLVAATNRDLGLLVSEGKFRSDLFFRLRSLTITLPPLRDRMDDIPLLADHFVARECRLRGGKMKGVDEGFYEALNEYSWPGNVRELSNAVACAVATAGNDPMLFSKHLPTDIRVSLVQAGTAEATVEDSPGDTAAGLQSLRSLPPLRDFRDRMEKDYLEAAVRQCRNDITALCRITGLSRAHAYSLLRKHELQLH